MQLMQKKTASASMENNVPTDVKDAKDAKDAKEMLTVSVSPHLHSGRTTQNIMLDVIIALCPALIAGTVIFGVRSLLVAAVCMATAVLSEFLFNRICKKEQTVGDLSAVVTGLLLALNLPAVTPAWQAAVGAFFAIVVVKCLFGGIGQNFANPAITARVFMLISFQSLAKMSLPTIVDVTAGATPLPILNGEAAGSLPSLTEMLLGLRGGAIGETCVVALLLGGIYLMVRRVISWHTPVCYVATVFLFTLALKGDVRTAFYHVLAGGLLLGALFMATDYATTPTSFLGKAIFGVGCGIITVVIRIFGNYPEGVSFAILLMNILTPYIDQWTHRRTFGVTRPAKCRKGSADR